jgi:hypothetical protein
MRAMREHDDGSMPSFLLLSLNRLMQFLCIARL